MEYILIFIAAVFVNNIVLAQFLGICPFLGVSKKVSTALGMTGAVTFVMILATLVTFGLALTIFAGIREHLELVAIPKGMKGSPIALITAGLLAMAFMGFSGIV